MTREEYLEMLATEPATPNQRGAILGEFTRLGVTSRAERLAVCAVLLGLDELGSTTNLVMGQAGQLVGALKHIRDRAGLPKVTMPIAPGEPAGEDSCPVPGGDGQDGGQDPAGEDQMSLAEAIKRFMLLLCVAFRGKDGEAKSGDIALHIERLGARGTFPPQLPASRAHSEEGPSDGGN